METDKLKDLIEDIELLNFRLCNSNKSKLSGIDIKILRSLKKNVDFVLESLNFQNKVGVRHVRK